MARTPKKKALYAACPASAPEPPPPPVEHHHHDHPEPAKFTGSIHVLLRTESDPSSRTGVAVRAYYYANGAPPQSLHLGGETERAARHAVLEAYPGATFDVETASPAKACCASCAQNKPCQSGCNPTSFPAGFAGEAGEPLLAVWDDVSEEVIGCGACAASPTTGGHPAVLRFEKAKRNPVTGRFALETAGETELSPELQSLYSQGGSCQGSACMPWVRIQRDPQRFRTAIEAARKIGPIRDPKDFYRFVKDHMTSEDQEVFYILLLDVHMQIRGISEISRGARDRVLTPIPDVLRMPLVDGATAFIVAHNHPSGKTTPSEADKEVTKAIKKGADAVDILMLDHIIVGAHGYYSFSEHGLV